jgi:L,D-transpeptidase-like protein
VSIYTRRHVLASAAFAVAGLGFAGRAGTPVQAGLSAIAAGLDPYLVGGASLALARHESAIWTRDVIAIADFGVPSSVPRFHLIDLLAGTVTSMLVTHGRGSDPDHTGMLQSFSNLPDSYATSEGAYLTGEAYDGIHGSSRRLIGLDPTNDNAEDRAIVIHTAPYAEAEMIPQQGKLGRSDGCFVFGRADLAIVLARLGRGRLIYASRAPA